MAIRTKIFFAMAQQPQWAEVSSLSRIHDHTQTQHTRQDSSGRVISQTQKHLPDNTQHSQETDVHAPGGIRIHNSSKREAADPRLRPRGHWDRPSELICYIKNLNNEVVATLIYINYMIKCVCQCLNAGFSSRIVNKLNSALRTNDQHNTRRHVGQLHCSHTH